MAILAAGVSPSASRLFRNNMKIQDFFNNPKIGEGNVSVWQHNDGSWFVIEVTRFAASDKESARQYAALLAGEVSVPVDVTMH